MLPNDSLRNAFSRLTFITGVTFGSQRFDCPFTDEWRTGAIKNILGSAVHQGHPGDVAADEAAPPSNRHSLRYARPHNGPIPYRCQPQPSASRTISRSDLPTSC